MELLILIYPPSLFKKKIKKSLYFQEVESVIPKQGSGKSETVPKKDFQVKYDSFLASLGDNLQQQVELH